MEVVLVDVENAKITKDPGQGPGISGTYTITFDSMEDFERAYEKGLITNEALQKLSAMIVEGYSKKHEPITR